MAGVLADPHTMHFLDLVLNRVADHRTQATHLLGQLHLLSLLTHLRHHSCKCKCIAYLVGLDLRHRSNSRLRQGKGDRWLEDILLVCRVFLLLSLLFESLHPVG